MSRHENKEDLIFTLYRTGFKNIDAMAMLFRLLIKKVLS